MRVTAWDGVFSPSTCASLQASTVAAGLGHSLFRPALPPRTHLEAALASVLFELEDNSTWVEYWVRGRATASAAAMALAASTAPHARGAHARSHGPPDSAPQARTPWKHIEAHADVDEHLARTTGQIRYPDHAHVLYLSVGSQVLPLAPAPSPTNVSRRNPRPNSAQRPRLSVPLRRYSPHRD